MRFAWLNLERYGAFSDRRLHFRPESHVHIVHGANEAGKTTALSAIGDLLFGFGHNTSHAFLHDAATLRLGASLRLGTGAELDFRRRKGKKTNTLLDADDKPLPDELLDPVTGTLTRDSFQAEFGLTAAALRKGGEDLVRTGGRLAEMLAASSAGLSALSRLASDVDMEANALFSERRAATKPFYLAEERYKAAGKSLNEAVVTVDAWKIAQAGVEQASDRLAAIAAGQKQLSAELAQWHRVKATARILRQIDGVRDKLAGLAHLPETDAAHTPLWRAALADDLALAQRCAELDDEAAGVAARMDNLAVDARLLKAAPLIEALRERIGAIDKARFDLPRRIADHGEAAEQLEGAARRLGLGSVDALLARQPAGGLDKARHIVAALRGAMQGLQKAQGVLAERRAATLRFAEAEDGQPHAIDPAPLKRRLEALANIGQNAERLRRETEVLARDERRLGDDLAKLQPGVASLEALARLRLPDAESIVAARVLFEAQARTQGDLSSQQAAQLEAQHQASQQISDMAVHGPVPTRNDLAVARDCRDAAMQALAGALETGISEVRAAELRAHVQAVQALGQRVDDLTDRLLGDSARAALRLAAEGQMARAEAALARLAIEQASQAARRTEAGQHWQGLWQASGLAPLEPARMLAWREKIRDIADRHQALEGRRIETATLAATLTAQRPALEALAVDVRHAPRAETSIDGLHREIVAAYGDIQDGWNQARARLAEQKMLDRNLAEAETGLKKAREQMETAREGFVPAALALGLPPEAGLDEAEATIAIWQGVGEPRVKMEREKRSIDSINVDLAEFDAAVVDLLEQAAPDRAGRGPRPALDVLVQRLADMRKIEAERAHLLAGQRQRQIKRDDLLRKIARAQALLAAGRQALGLAEDAPLATALDMLGARDALRAQSHDHLAQLQQQADGHSEAALRAEQAGIEPDGMAGLINACNANAELLQRDFAEATVGLRAAEAFCANLELGRNAEASAQARAEASAELGRIGEAWLVRAIAVRLARAAIERHRASAQDPVIARASALFARLTSGGFSGLATDFDDNDTPSLVGARANGGKNIKVHEMSEGTRDQLFLVLRLALLEQRGGEPMPFIGDDLLASFDETRTGEALDVLAQFGQRSQVILFTHHAHVVDIARARLGGRVDIVTL